MRKKYAGANLFHTTVCIYIYIYIYILKLKLRFPVAQLVEHGASNAKIMGSIPRESKS